MGTAARWALGAFAVALFSSGWGEPLRIDAERSAIAVSGNAWGFIPADFAFSAFEATVEVGPEAALERADFAFSYLDLTCGHPRRDAKIHAWLEADAFPEGRFRLERTESDESGQRAIGQLCLRGEWREAVFEYALDSEGEAATLRATARIDSREWGLSPLRILLFKVDPVLTIRLSIHGHR